MALMFDHKILTVLSTVRGLQQGSRRTHSVRSGANLWGSLHWPDQIRCQWTKLPSFPLVVAVWEQKQPPTSLRTAGLKGESHARLNFRPDQKECDLGLGRQQSLSAQQWGFGEEDPKHQIASGKTRFSQQWSKVIPFFSLSLSLSFYFSWGSLLWEWCKLNYSTRSFLCLILRCQGLKIKLFLYVSVLLLGWVV